MPYWRLFYHVVWGTKHRLALIDPAWENDLYGYIRGKATAMECFVHAIGGMSDHIHVAISIPPKLSVATLIGQLKGASSHHVNKSYCDGSFMWQAEYGVFSFSEKALSSIAGYINNQKKHHAENTLNVVMENMAGWASALNLLLSSASLNKPLHVMLSVVTLAPPILGLVR